MDLGLRGKVAMVAGASRGLGFAVARGLAAEGASVSIASRAAQSIDAAAERITAETGSPALATAVDVRAAESLAAWHARTLEEFGGVDLCSSMQVDRRQAPRCRSTTRPGRGRSSCWY
jgi:3-oxoacyl-[acyl-carrier protein] reductase